MLRNKKQDTSFNQSSLNILNLSQTTGQSMEREIDNYTRKLQQDKRKYFRAQQNHNEILKEYATKNKQLEALKSKKYKTQLLNLKNQIKTLQSNLDQSINSYNDALAKNNRLKLQIDQLRKEKKNQTQSFKHLNHKLANLQVQMIIKREQIEDKRSNTKKLKQEIIKIKEQNQVSASMFEKEVHEIKETFNFSARQNQKTKKDEKGVKTQSIDTQPLVKLRLRNIIFKNKQKVKIIQQYKKNMELIYKNFEEIKQESGVQDLQQITKMFLKQQEQNLFIYEYINKLNSTIQDLTEQNHQIKQTIQIEEQSVKQWRSLMSGTPDDERKRRDFLDFKQKQQKKIQQTNKFFASIQSSLKQVLTAYQIIAPETQLTLSIGNFNQYISEVQRIISNISNQPLNEVKSELKDDVTKYTKSAPAIEETKEKTDQKLWEQGKLREVAIEYWDKKKAARMVNSKTAEE